MDATLTALTPANEAAMLAEATPDAVATLPETALQRLKALPVRNKWLIGVGVAGMLAMLVSLTLWNRADNYAPLFTGSVSDKDAGAATTQLSTMNVPYKVLDGGRIMVPAEKAAELRMKLAAAGLPKSMAPGWESLDNPRYGQSQLQERTSLQRALEGELTRTISTLSAVESARVHLAMPQQNGFYREQVKPSASVVLSLHPGHMLDRSQIAGIVHLVSSSVPDLQIKAVSVIDQNGSLLSGDPSGDAKQDMTVQQRQHVAAVETIYLKRVQEILEAALGKDQSRATVTADIDFSESEQASETYRPNQTPDAAAVRSQRNLETVNGANNTPTGVPGAASNQPGQTATAPLTGASAPLQAAGMNSTGGGLRKENQINYEVDKTVRNTRNQSHAIKRVNVAVLVNYRLGTVDPKAKNPGAPKPEAPSAEELQKLTALVQEAVGYSKERGDSVKVEALPFRIEAPKLEELPLWKQPWVIDLIKVAGIPAVMTLVALLLVFAVIRPALKKPIPEPTAEELAAKAAAEAGLEAVVDDDVELPVDAVDLIAIETAQLEEKLIDARQLVRDNPVAVANILLTWMHGDDTPIGAVK